MALSLGFAHFVVLRACCILSYAGFYLRGMFHLHSLHNSKSVADHPTGFSNAVSVIIYIVLHEVSMY